MNLEKEIFKKRKVIKERLVPFGFTEEDGKFTYSELFHEGEFRAEVHVSRDGEVTGCVTDLDTGDEFIPIRIESQVGAFVGTVREEYEEILLKIADACFRKTEFIFDQANRITYAIKEIYGEDPDYPFEKMSGYGVFRYPETRKWYGLVMGVRRNLLKGAQKSDESLVEVINLKAKPEDMEKLLETPGIYPGYHMNRANWISVLLDDTLTDHEILELIHVSRDFAMKGSRVRKASEGPVSWIVPANPKYYDIETAFTLSKDVIWKQSSKINKGDIVYMYVGAPVSAVKYMCEVKEVNIPYSYADKNVSMAYIMRMDVLKDYEDGVCGFSKLQELGIKAVRGPRTVTEDFLKYMKGKGKRRTR